MSTINKTPNLKLPQYTKEDIFDMTEINESYQTIDNAYGEIVESKNKMLNLVNSFNEEELGRVNAEADRVKNFNDIKANNNTFKTDINNTIDLFKSEVNTNIESFKNEIYSMIENLLFSPMTINEIKKNGSDKLVDMYVVMVKRGLKTIEEVPARYREQVIAIIEELER